MEMGPLPETKKKRLNDTEVGILALICMYEVVLFFILSLLALILISTSFFLLSELGILSEKISGLIFLVLFISSEIILITVLSFQGRNRFIYASAQLKNETEEADFTGGPKKIFTFTETHLEIAILVTALGSLLWCFILGMPPLSLKVVLTVVESFAGIFLLMFVIVRFLATKEVRLTALATLVLTWASIAVVIFK